MKNSSQKVTGILMAGGMSSRMGREKGTLMIGGRMMYEYPLQALELVCDEILISSCTPLPGSLSYPMVCDKISGIGPMGGIHSCLERSSNDLNLVISYDLPLINAGLLSYLIENSEAWEVVVPAMLDGRLEPLSALYRKSMGDLFGTMIEQRKYAVHKAIAQARSLIIDIQPDMPFYHPNLFLNINRIQDLESLPKNFR
ncbi:MAG: molybdenum cofactor guanylyltransferase [Bacteroides sp.]|nr:molybdenum cofactor guanylyltransferase [Bacteroides sp.]